MTSRLVLGTKYGGDLELGQKLQLLSLQPHQDGLCLPILQPEQRAPLCRLLSPQQLKHRGFLPIKVVGTRVAPPPVGFCLWLPTQRAQLSENTHTAMACSNAAAYALFRGSGVAATAGAGDVSGMHLDAHAAEAFSAPNASTSMRASADLMYGGASSSTRTSAIGPWMRDQTAMKVTPRIQLTPWPRGSGASTCLASSRPSCAGAGLGPEVSNCASF